MLTEDRRISKMNFIDKPSVLFFFIDSYVCGKKEIAIPTDPKFNNINPEILYLIKRFNL